MDTTRPDYLRAGALVKVAEWYGEVVDVAVTDGGRVMVLVTSPKAVYRNHRDEWLEFSADLIQPATPEEYRREIEYYMKRTALNLSKLERMQAVWQGEAVPAS